MKSALVLTGLALCLLAPHLQAQEAARKPGPEIQRLSPWTGKWKLTETITPSPFGPAGTATYRLDTRYIHGGWATEGKGQGKGPQGPISWTEVTYYDQVARTFRSLYVDSDGMASSSPQTLNGNSLVGTWETNIGGRKFSCRAISTVAADGKTFTYQWTYSEDGTTWKPWLNGTGRKVGAR